MESLARATRKVHCSVGSLNYVRLILLRDGRKANHIPRFQAKHMADKIVFMQSLHDEDNASLSLIVEPTVQGVIEPVVDGLALGVRKSLLGFQRVIDNDEIGAPPGQGTPDRCGKPKTL